MGGPIRPTQWGVVVQEVFGRLMKQHGRMQKLPLEQCKNGFYLRILYTCVRGVGARLARARSSLHQLQTLSRVVS